MERVKGKPPNRVLGRGHQKYHLPQYIVGVGFSESSSVSANESGGEEEAIRGVIKRSENVPIRHHRSIETLIRNYF